ncbi:Geraniol 8-hydroxylase [Spatholobus suberectus]|nr:Geraniol 8-hydroxylase [Spatholobus suberectus]
MDSVISILLLLLTCTIIHVFSNKIRRKRNHKLPPGPSPLALVGNLYELGKKPQQTLAKLAVIHGPIMRLKLGQLTTIVISSPDIAKEVLQTHDLLFSNRTIPQATTVHNHNHYSLPFLPISPLWRDLRKICNNQLFSHESLDSSQNLRRHKLHELLNDVHTSSLSGEAVDIGTVAFRTLINFLSNTFFSLDFVNSVGDQTEEYKGIVENLVRAIATPNLVDFFPLLKLVDPQGIRKRSSTYISKLFVIFDHLIDKRLEFGGDVTNNDMLDTLLNISQEDGQKMDNKKIKHLFLDLIVAGTDSTSYAIKWAMTELINNPDAMSKAKRELEQTIGIGNPVEESDITKLTYLHAIVKETLRMHPSAPLLLPRKAKIDVEINGYTIPQGAQILINEWAIGRNPSIWDNPSLFSPERFLGSEIDVKGRHSQLTPFGGGRRICPGLPLAMKMLHLMLGSLINTFDWKLENDVNPDIDMGQSLRAIPFRINKQLINM